MTKSSSSDTFLVVDKKTQDGDDKIWTSPLGDCGVPVPSGPNPFQTYFDDRQAMGQPGFVYSTRFRGDRNFRTFLSWIQSGPKDFTTLQLTSTGCLGGQLGQVLNSLTTEGKLQDLNLSCNTLDNADVVALANYLKGDGSRLRTLNLETCSLAKVTDWTLTKLGEALKGHNHLKELNLAGNGFRNGSAARLLTLLPGSLLNKLQVLNLSNNRRSICEEVIKNLAIFIRNRQAEVLYLRSVTLSLDVYNALTSLSLGEDAKPLTVDFTGNCKLEKKATLYQFSNA